MINSILAAKQTLAVNLTQAPSQLNTANSKNIKTATDTVNISNVAKSLFQNSILPPDQRNSESLSDIDVALSETTAALEEQLQTLYSKYGISSDSSMTISVASDGSILVNGNSPESETLADAINADDGISNSIRELSAKAALLEAAKKHQEFTEAYKKDPKSAIEEYGYLFDDNKTYHTTFSMQNGHIDINVEYY